MQEQLTALQPVLAKTQVEVEAMMVQIEAETVGAAGAGTLRRHKAWTSVDASAGELQGDGVRAIWAG